MGQEDDNLNATIAHVVLCCVAARGASRLHSRSFTSIGMHGNLFVHGVLGILHYQSGIFNSDFKQAFEISLKASKYLPLPCLNADLYRGDNVLSLIHLLSGLVPFVIAIGGKDNVKLGNLMIALNIVSLCHYSLQNSRDWALFTATAGAFAYFFTAQIGTKAAYPLGLALMEYCAYRVIQILFSSSP